VSLQVVLASNNAKKLAELQALFASLPMRLVAQGSLGIPEADEPHITFVENALAKARHAALASGHPAIADDSGLCVAALAGDPGVASAHYADVTLPKGDRERQRTAQDSANNAKLLQALGTRTDRAARYVSVLVALRHADDPEPLVAFGRWEGEVLCAPRGDGGFGYDPLMFIPSLGCTVAELDAARKNAVSHRAAAAGQMVRLMREAWAVG
jgi:XTP/dITP diphosphohydrolase